MTRPNILLITVDQMRWDCLACGGNPVIRTPHLDQLAAEGTRFTNAFTPTPICIPARATIMTGNYAHVCTGQKSNNGGIRGGQALLTRVLQSAGYACGAIGKLHFVPYAPPDQPRLLHGFDPVELMESGRILQKFDPEGRRRGLEDYFDFLGDQGWHGYARAHGVGNNDVRPCPSPLPAELYVDHWIGDRTIAALDRHDAERKGQPFFLWMSSPKPHSPYDPPQPWDRLHDPRGIPPPFGPRELIREKNPAIEKSAIEHGCPSVSPEAWQVIRNHYYGNIAFIDRQIGRVLARVEELGLRDKTLVLFTSDHGDLLGDFGACFKCNHLNGSVRVPWIMRGPGVRAGTLSSALVGLQDILPTFAAAAGATIPTEVQGLDLSPVLAGTAGGVRPLYYSTCEEAGKQTAMVTDGHWKYIHSEWGGTEELYDQTQDPGEIRNLALDPAFDGLRREWRAKLIGEAQRLLDPIAAHGDLPSVPFDRQSLSSCKTTESSLGWRWY